MTALLADARPVRLDGQAVVRLREPARMASLGAAFGPGLRITAYRLRPRGSVWAHGSGAHGLSPSGCGRYPENRPDGPLGADMRYALLLYLDPTRAAATTSAEAEAELSAYAQITQDLATDGVLRGGEAFMPAQKAKVVRVSDASVVTVPALPTGLELSGFYILDCEENQALEIAARLPVATHGAVEVRPLMELPEPPKP